MRTLHSDLSMCLFFFLFFFFFFNDTATTEIYTLSLHDALPICEPQSPVDQSPFSASDPGVIHQSLAEKRSEEHTSELQSLAYLVCRLLLEKKKTQIKLISNTASITKLHLIISATVMPVLSLPPT